MLKHGFAALMILHDAETPLCSTDYFSDAETPRCNTVHFSNAETPLKNTGHCSPTPKHLCSALFTSSQSQKHPIPPSFSLPKQLRPALVSFFLPLPFLQHHSQQLFLLLKHRLSATFHPSPRCWNTTVQHFLSLSIIFFTPSSTKQFRPAIVSSLCWNTIIQHIIHPCCSNTISQQPSVIHPQCWNTLLQHHLILLRYWNTSSQQFFIIIFRSFSVAATPALHRQYK